MQTEILIYDGFDELDAIGPFEVLSPLKPKLVTLKPTDTVTASHALTLIPHATLSKAPGLLIVPGGGWLARNEQTGAYAEYLRGDIPAAIAERHARGSDNCERLHRRNCSSPKAGLLDGRPAITHHTALDDLRAAGADVQPHARWVDDGDILTAGGVTSGIDLALHLLERFLGAEAAQRREHVLEHRRVDRAPTPWGHRNSVTTEPTPST